jgi:hypothetical protein
MTPPSCSHQRRLNVKVRELGSAYRQFQRLGRCARAPGAAETGERPGGSREPMDPTLHGTRGAGVLSLTLSQGRARPPSTGWSYSVVAASVHPDHPADMRQQNASHRQLDDHRRRPAAKDNQQLPTDLPKRASYPAGVPATGERPGHQTGLSSSRGVRLFPRRLAARVVVRGVYPFRRCAITSSSSSKTTQRTSALPQSSGIEGVPPMSLGRRGAIACGPSECCIGSRLAGQAAPKGADRARPR